MNFQDNLIENEPGVERVVKGSKRVAVLGIKTEEQSDQPAFYVPEYLNTVGIEVVPVPVYYPDAKEILGKPVYRRLVDVPGELDLVDVFRRPKDLEAHLEDILAKKPKAVWFQSGIRNDAVARSAGRRGHRCGAGPLSDGGPPPVRHPGIGFHDRVRTGAVVLPAPAPCQGFGGCSALRGERDPQRGRGPPARPLALQRSCPPSIFAASTLVCRPKPWPPLRVVKPCVKSFARTSGAMPRRCPPPGRAPTLPGRRAAPAGAAGPRDRIHGVPGVGDEVDRGSASPCACPAAPGAGARTPG